MAVGQFVFTVTRNHDGQTVKTFLRRGCGLSARTMTVLKYAGMGISRDEVELRAHDVLHTGDQLRIVLPAEENPVIPVAGTLSILFEDDRLLIVDKPTNMPVHPTKKHQRDTLANLVAQYQQDRGEAYTFRALNRLDKDTSGIVLIAKDRITYSLVQPTVQKMYTAVCEGIIPSPGSVDLPIALAPNSTMRRCVGADGARAVTHYEPVARGSRHTLCRLTLETGRTHQIRCHMCHIGHPLAGDDLYGGSTALLSRQALHCTDVQFIHPDTHEVIRLHSDFPSQWLTLISEDPI